MPAKRRRTTRDALRRQLGQNFLADPSEIERLIRSAEIEPGELIVEIGAGTGALTLPLAAVGTRVLAIERDPACVTQLHRGIEGTGAETRVEVVEADFKKVPLPSEAFRVISNPPFGLTTALLAHLFDHPERGPWRADLLVQQEVARKRSVSPPTTLRSAAWAPWWEFSLGPTVCRGAFHPVPSVDAAVLVARRRDPGVLPDWLAPRMRELLRHGWHLPA